jgi:hypothetical protein
MVGGAHPTKLTMAGEVARYGEAKTAVASTIHVAKEGKRGVNPRERGMARVDWRVGRMLSVGGGAYETAAGWRCDAGAAGEPNA